MAEDVALTGVLTEQRAGVGLSPSSVHNAYEGKAAIVGQDRALQARRSALGEQFAMAAMAKDEEGKAEAREAIQRFNEKNPARRSPCSWPRACACARSGFGRLRMGSTCRRSGAMPWRQGGSRRSRRGESKGAPGLHFQAFDLIHHIQKIGDFPAMPA